MTAVLPASLQIFPKTQVLTSSERDDEYSDAIVLYKPRQRHFYFVLAATIRDQKPSSQILGNFPIRRDAVSEVPPGIFVETKAHRAEMNFRSIYHILLLGPYPEQVEKNCFSPPTLGKIRPPAENMLTYLGLYVNSPVRRKPRGGLFSVSAYSFRLSYAQCRSA